MMGFKPRNSLILLALDSERTDGMSGPLARVDIEDNVIPERVALDILDFVTDYSVTTLAIAWFGDDLASMVASRGASTLHEAALIAQEFIDDRYRREDFGFVTCLLTDYASWIDARYLEGDSSLGELKLMNAVARYDSIENSALATQLVFAGSAPLDIEPDYVWQRVGSRQRRVALASYKRNLSKVRGAQLWTNTLRAAVEETTPLLPMNAIERLGGKDRIGRLNAGLSDVFVRDRVLLWAINPEVDSLVGVTPQSSEELLSAAADHLPDEKRIDAAVAVLGACGSYSSDEDASAYAVIAYLYWWKGEAHKAMENVEYALASNPNYGLAQLIKHAVSVHLPPPWYRARDEWAEAEIEVR